MDNKPSISQEPTTGKSLSTVWGLVLMAEDNDGDVFMTTDAFKAAKVANGLSVV